MEVAPNSLLLSLAICFATDVLEIPSESVCQREHALARTFHCEVQRAFEVGGGWRQQQLLAQAKRREELWWAFWWVRWPQASDQQRSYWYGRSLELRFGNP